MTSQVSDLIGGVLGGSNVKPVRGFCERHGDYKSISIYTPAGWTSENGFCPACMAEQSKRESVAWTNNAINHREEVRVRGFLDNRINSSGVPRKFLRCSFENYRVDTSLPEDAQSRQLSARRFCEDYANKFIENIERDKWILFLGGVGTGKTHLACAIVNKVMREGGKGCAGKYMMSSSVLRHLRSGGYGTEQKMMDELIDFDGILILDDIAWQSGSEADRLALSELIAGRYAQERSLLMMSNIPAGDVSRFIGEQAFDRVREQATTILFNWKSNRINPLKSLDPNERINEESTEVSIDVMDKIRKSLEGAS